MPRLPIRLSIVDDHTLFRKMLEEYLSQQPSLLVSITASDIFDLLNKFRSSPTDILIMDVFMPNIKASEALKIIRTEFPDIRIIILSMSVNLTLINELLEIGIHAYISKADEPDSLIQAIHSTYEGKIYRNKLLTDALYLHNQMHLKKNNGRNTVHFNEREKRVLQLLWEEKSNKDIANEIFLSVRSIEKIRQDMKEKLGVKSTIGLLKYALNNRIIETNNQQVANIEQQVS